MKFFKLILKVLSMAYMIKYIFLPKMYNNLSKYFLNILKLNYISMMIC